MEIITTIVIMMLLFGVTIFIHELGHFLVGRWLGLKAEVFSIGFGPALWKKTVYLPVFLPQVSQSLMGEAKMPTA